MVHLFVIRSSKVLNLMEIAVLPVNDNFCQKSIFIFLRENQKLGSQLRILCVFIWAGTIILFCKETLYGDVIEFMPTHGIFYKYSLWKRVNYFLVKYNGQMSILTHFVRIKTYKVGLTISRNFSCQFCNQPEKSWIFK